ncbi:DUF84 family protein [Ureibacillus sinduriensis]|uniref:inosine/xanthosine triphosphatase n=1 Tax=Ureibacillus sinduriensis BLB-1 = JCM 15800 TaxID=1384057 RepID=A0A0A3HYY1_9BACL|nr:DUF84 family protein [Ureibacillus sinduriensis]KGR77664.1 NTPase [Ureibacillus sinduriensis BLB-1 = JCM 15800]
MLVAIGTNNKAKIAAIQNIVNQYFENVQYVQVAAASNVSEQPFSNEETRQGAINRAVNTLEEVKGDLNFGLEGGVHELDDFLYCTNWGALALKDGTVFSAAGAQFALPEVIAKELRAGKELGPVMDNYTKQRDTRLGSGAVGIFTAGLVDRTEMFEHIVKLLIGQYLFLVKK